MTAPGSLLSEAVGFEFALVEEMDKALGAGHQILDNVRDPAPSHFALLALAAACMLDHQHLERERLNDRRGLAR